MTGFSCTVLTLAALTMGGCASGVSLPARTPSLESMTEVSENLVAKMWDAYSATNVVLTYRAGQDEWLISRRTYF